MIHQEAQQGSPAHEEDIHQQEYQSAWWTIYARAKEGRFLLEKTFGYSKVGEGKQRHLSK
jgi:hypothetical protein